jgi:hypothetical protein
MWRYVRGRQDRQFVWLRFCRKGAASRQRRVSARIPVDRLLGSAAASARAGRNRFPLEASNAPPCAGRCRCRCRCFLTELEFTLLIQLRHPHFAIGTDDFIVIGITRHTFVGTAADLAHAGQVPGKTEWAVAALAAVVQRKLRIPATSGGHRNRQFERSRTGRPHGAPAFADGGNRCAFGDGGGGDAQLLLIRPWSNPLRAGWA